MMILFAIMSGSSSTRPIRYYIDMFYLEVIIAILILSFNSAQSDVPKQDYSQQ